MWPRASVIPPPPPPPPMPSQWWRRALDSAVSTANAAASAAAEEEEDAPSPIRWVLGFLLVGMAWGLTTPFIRKAAVNVKSPERPFLQDPRRNWFSRFMLGVFYKVFDFLRNPRYAVPLLINLTGSVWFFLLIGKAGESALLSSWGKAVD